MSDAEAATDPGTETDEHWQSRWSPEERESFFTAIDRNRRASWQVGTAAGVAALVVAFIVASLMAPLLYGVAGLMLDLVNLVLPAPDLIGAMFERIDRMIEALPDDSAGGTPVDFSWVDWLGNGVLAALPGLLLMTACIFALHRALRSATTLDGHGLRTRAPHSSRLEERRFGNVVAEMSIAALQPEPEVRITHRDMGNAIFIDDTGGRPVIVASMDLLASLDRDAMQGVAAHLVASLCNGDVRNGHHIGMVTALFALLARMATGFAHTSVLTVLGRLLGAAVWPSTDRTRRLLADLADPFAAPDAPASKGPEDNHLTWRNWAWMPVSGPIAMSGFFAGIVATFILSPMLAWVWRRRRLLADATAVRLTRNPDAVARGLQSAAGVPHTEAVEPWAAHLAVIEPPRGTKDSQRSFIDGAVLSYYPDLRQRLEALAAQGADVHLDQKPGIPLHILAVMLPLAAIVVVLFAVLLYLLIVVSLMLSMLFTLMPVALLHFLLR